MQPIFISYLPCYLRRLSLTTRDLRTLSHPERLRKRNRGQPLARTDTEMSEMRVQSAMDSDCSNAQHMPNPIAPPKYATAWDSGRRGVVQHKRSSEFQ